MGNSQKKKSQYDLTLSDNINKFNKAIFLLLDYGIGTNFVNDYNKKLDPAYFENNDISGFCFVGMSIEYEPITRNKLIEYGFKGAEKAILTYQDILNLEDEERRNNLIDRLKIKLQKSSIDIQEDKIISLIPLFEAAKKGDLDRVLTCLKGDQKVETTENITASLIIASEKGFFEIVRSIMENAKIDSKIILQTQQNARKNGQLEIADYLFTFQDVNEKDEKGEALIHKAASKCDIDEIKKLLARGANINLENKYGSTPLIILMRNPVWMFSDFEEKGISLLKFLLENGANPNKFNDESPLFCAAESHSLNAFQFFYPLQIK